MATMPQHLKGLSEELARRPLCFRVVALLALSCLCFYIGKRWASRYDEIAMYSGASSPALSYSSSSHEGHVTLVTDLRGEEEEQGKEQMQQSDTPVRPPPPPPPPPNVVLSPSGVLHEDGSIITKEFPLDEQASIEGDDATSGSSSSSSSSIEETSKGSNSQALKPIRFDVCPPSMKEYIPCLDNVAEINKLPSTQRGEKWERHCPRKEVSCIIPAPTGYKFPIRWPRSRDEVWYKNVPHTKLVEDKGGQNWIAIKKDKFIFPGGGTQFAHGADQYLDQMAKMVPEIAFGVHTRVALDVGCGVASWGAYLMSRDVLPLSIAPKDVHENQIQFALERGVPAMVGVFATRRLLYPSEAFDLIHCSRCRIEWTRDGGVLLLEVDRLLRPGGFFAWAAQPVYKHEGSLPEEWKSMANLSESLCWTLVAKEGYIAIWQKPSNNTCYKNRSVGSEPPLCSIDNDPDDVWYAPMTHCITGLREINHDNKITDWPMRLHIPPARLQSLRNDANTAKEEAFFADQHFWKEIAGGYLRGLGLKVDEVRNVMDMNAGYAGFAAALVDLKVSWWVMNIVPVNGLNTLPVIYDRGLLGVAHDWCEAFDTYPRTYDLLHASGLFTMTKDRCSVARIVVEMDRILRPGGTALIRDLLDTIKEVEQVAKAVKWQTRLLDTESGPYGKDRLLQCKKVLWHAD